MTQKGLAESRTRLQQEGAATLSPVELLSLILGLDAGHIWTEYQSLIGLVQSPWEELTALNGVGPATACRLKAALELSRRLLRADEVRPQITSPADAARLLLPEMGHLEQEQLWVLILDTKNYVKKTHIAYRGTVNSCMLRTCEIFRPAIRLNATSIIVAHNHPSGCVEASPEDITATRNIVTAGKLLEIELLDHLIIGHPPRWLSLKEQGVFF